MLSPELARAKETYKAVKKQIEKVYDYKLEDFEIIGGNWKHKDWKVWMKGANGYSETKKIVERYIAECKKPFAQRNIDFIHIAIS